MKLPIVVIVGRVNTGKSTLFNRLLGKPLAVTDERPGVTRDTIKKPAEHDGAGFLIVDTGGFMGEESPELWPEVKKRIESAVREADAIIFLTDAKDGLLPLDREIAGWLRKSGRPVLLAANKCDSRKSAPSDFHAFGFEVFPISSITGEGVSDLLDRVIEIVGRVPPLPQKTGLIRISIIGKPNVGKSSLLNALAERDEAVISPIPGTTRDPVEAVIGDFLIVDTAGIKRKFSDDLEYYSYLRSLRSLRYGEICLAVLDAAQEITRIDKKIVNLVISERRGLVLCLNKIDLVPKKKRALVLEEVRKHMGFAYWAPVLLVSALSREGINEIPGIIKALHREFHRQVGQDALYDLLVDAAGRVSPGTMLFALKQVRSAPPSFQLFAKERIRAEYLSFLEREIRARFSFAGIPLKIEVSTPKRKG
ncbi:MAG: ribosome biogenesis GTPase Der [candidate division WOR-3 bacterium]